MCKAIGEFSFDLFLGVLKKMMVQLQIAVHHRQNIFEWTDSSA